MGEKSGKIVQAGPSCTEADCEGSEGETKHRDVRLDKKAGTRPGRVLCFFVCLFFMLGRVLCSESMKQKCRLSAYSTAKALLS